MTYTLANSAHENNAGTQGSLTIPTSTIGNLGVITFCYSTDATITAITGGGTWAKIGTTQTDAGNGQKVEWWWTIFTSAVTSLTYVNIDASTVAYCEFNSSVGFNASPLRSQDTTKAFAATSATTDAETSNSITTVAADLVVADLGDTGGNQASIAHGTGWTTGVNEIGASGTGASALEWLTAAGTSQSGTFTVGTAAHNYTMQIASFIPASAGPAPTGSFVTHLGGRGAGW